jgi:hypothetical protein
MTVLDIKAAVRKRDGFRCVDCGITQDEYGITLEVHRLKPGSAYTADGCVTTCAGCHGKRHRGTGTHGRPALGQVKTYRSPVRRESVMLSPELHDAFLSFVAQCDPPVTKTAVMVAALQEFFQRRGMWPRP